jgi:hypothetical protein
MFGYDEGRDSLTDAQDRLSRLIARGEFDKALQFFIENREHIPMRRRRFYFSCIRDGLSGHSFYRHVIRSAIIMLIVTLLIEPLFALRVLDFFAFLSRQFLYYNYFVKLLPRALNMFFIIFLIRQWYTWISLPQKLFDRQIKAVYRIAFVLAIAAASVYVGVQTVPIARDLPMVLGGQYLSRSISEAEHIAMIYGEIIRTTDREDVAATLRRELRDLYGREYDDGDYPVPYYHYEKHMGRDIC